MLFNKYLIKRDTDDVVVAILPHKDTGKFSYVNLTKGHICSCQFDTVDKAIEDMKNKIAEGSINNYIPIVCDSVPLKNIRLDDISISEEYAKFDEEVKEFKDSMLEVLQNSNYENVRHVIEELWDVMQSGIGYISFAGITSQEVMDHYPLHLEKIKNRPR